MSTMEDESPKRPPRSLGREMMDERAWPASRLEELVFKRGVSGKIDIIISRARIHSAESQSSFRLSSSIKSWKNRALSLAF